MSVIWWLGGCRFRFVRYIWRCRAVRVLYFVGIVRLAIVLFAGGVGVCGVALLSFGVG